MTCCMNETRTNHLFGTILTKNRYSTVLVATTWSPLISIPSDLIISVYQLSQRCLCHHAQYFEEYLR